MTKTAEQIALAWRVADFIQAYPDKHDQGAWIGDGTGYPLDIDSPQAFADVFNTCGTTACAAGWTVLLTGHTFVSYIDVAGVPRIDATRVACNGEKTSFVADRARDLLGLDQDEAHDLFHSARTGTDVIRQIEKTFGPRPFVPGYDAVTP